MKGNGDRFFLYSKKKHRYSYQKYLTKYKKYGKINDAKSKNERKV